MLLTAFLLLFSTTAWAGECQPLYEAEARELIDASYAALEGEQPDLAEHDRLMRQIQTRIPCADWEIDAATWQSYLISMAVRNYFGGQDWRSPMTTAVRIDPSVELPVRKGHPLRDFVPAPPPSDRGPLPEGVSLRLDGRPLQAYRKLDSWALLQRWNGDELQTAVVREPGDIPQAFLTKPRLPSAVRRVKRRNAIHTWGSAGGGALLATGLVISGVGLARNSSFNAEQTPVADLPDLEEQGRRSLTSGAVLLGSGAVALSATWTIPW